MENINLDEISDEENNEDDEHTESSRLYRELKNLLRLRDNEWNNLAFQLLLGKLIMDYRVLLLESKKEDKRKQNLWFPYKVGELITTFVERRDNDRKKTELVDTSKTPIKRQSIINKLVQFLKSFLPNEETQYGARYIRYFCELYTECDWEELDQAIPYGFYLELLQKTRRDVFKNKKIARSFRNRVINLKKEKGVSNFQLRVIMNLIYEDPENRANADYFIETHEKIRNLSPLKMKDGAMEKAKQMIEKYEKSIKTLDEFIL